MYGGIEGTIHQNELTRSFSTSKSSLAQNVTHHMLTVKNSVVTNGLAGANNGNYVLNTKEAILRSLSVSVQATDPSQVFLFFEPTSFSTNHAYYNIPYCNEVESTVTGTFNTAVDTPVYTGLIALNGVVNIDLSPYRITIPPGSQVSIAVRSTNGITQCTAALVWSED
jgi:hypothetical protein